MRIQSIQNIAKTIGISAVTIGAMASAPIMLAKPYAKTDTFEQTTAVPKGTTSRKVLDNAPDPKITIAGKQRTATFVVDITENVLYKYDKDGNAEEAFLVASGKPKSPTTPGVRQVTYVESYPYKSSPSYSKRRRQPRAYGPKIIHIEMINPKTGEITTDNGEWIHGNNDSSSLGHHKSAGCIRMDNDVIKELASQVKRGDIVIIKK